MNKNLIELPGAFQVILEKNFIWRLKIWIKTVLAFSMLIKISEVVALEVLGVSDQRLRISWRIICWQKPRNSYATNDLF